MSYQWTVVNQDPGSIQFCVIQSGFYRNCVTVDGSSTLPFVIPDSIVQQFGTPTGYLVTYTRVQVTTSTKPLPSNGTTIVVPAYSGCNPLLTQGQGYPPLTPCNSPLIFIKSESTPYMFIENNGTELSGFDYGFGIAGNQLAIAMGPNWEYYKQYPPAQVYLIGNWKVVNGNYLDLDSGRTYCGCPGKSVYIIPNSDLPKPTSASSNTSTTSTTSTTSASVYSTGNATVIIKNTCSLPLIARGVYNGLQYFSTGTEAPTKESLPIGSTVQFLYNDKVISEVTVRYDGQVITPTNCPQPSTTLMAPPPGNLRVAVRNPCSFPITIVDSSNPNNLILVAHPGFNGYTFIPYSVSSVRILYNYRYDLGTYPVSPNSVIEPSSCQLITPFRITSTTSVMPSKPPSTTTVMPPSTRPLTTTSTTSVQPSASQSAVTRYVTTTVPVTSTVSVPVTKTVIVPVTNTVPITVTNTIPVTTTVTSTLPVTTTVSTPPPSQPTKIGIFGILGLLIQGLDRLLGINSLQPIQSQVTPGQRKPGCQTCN